tara:strand:- start:1238 stop:2224 length:987 start_codon:yes stop_codon:yes gene_type:complete
MLLDTHGRHITDLRLSVTDRCNFRCTYCLDPGVRFLPRQELLHLDEYVRIIAACMSRGVRTLRITGGEPTLYPELDELILEAGAMGLDDMAMTTNGWAVDGERARRWLDSGLRRLTFSLDTLREDRMKEITRSRTSVKQVLRSIEVAREAGFPRPKLNMVVMRDVNEDEVVDFAQLARDRDLDVRFIEFMPLGSARDWTSKDVHTARETRAAIESRWSLRPFDGDHAHSTSVNWTFADGADGKLGFIAPVSQPFCGACNRLRITAEGRIRPCLFSHDEWDLKPILRRGSSNVELERFLIDAAWNKQSGHAIGEETFEQPERSMSAIGG